MPPGGDTHIESDSDNIRRDNNLRERYLIGRRESTRIFTR